MKTEFKGTPGPWKVCGRDKLTIEGADGSDVGQVLSQADSSLIAAAPELLEALQGMIDMWRLAADHFDWGKSCLDAKTIQLVNEAPGLAQKAITKALEG